MNPEKKHFPGAGKFDKINSTFKSIIIFNNTQRVPFLEGYSKGLLQEKEPDDKIYMLQAWIIRLLNNGYLSASKTVRIEFYLKSFLSNNDELILILEPLSYRIEHEKYLMNDRLNSFLQRMYNQLKNGSIVTKDLISKKLPITEDDIFSLRAGRFANEDELRAYCIKKIKEGRPEGLVKNFFYKYKGKHFDNWKEEKPVIPADTEKKTEQVVQNLANNFTKEK